MDDVKTFLSTTFKRFYEQHKDVSRVQVKTLIWKTFFDGLNVFFQCRQTSTATNANDVKTFLTTTLRRFVNGKITTFCYDASWRHKDTFVDGKVKVCMSDNEAFILTTLWRLTTLISTTLWSLTTSRRINCRCHNPVFSLTWRQCYKKFYFFFSDSWPKYAAPRHSALRHSV
jgi:hypothetical protein